MRYRWILSQAAAVNGMYVRVYAKGYRGSGHLSLVLYVRNLKSLRLGWKRRANYCFVLLNQSGKELFRSPGWGVLTTLPLTTLQNVIPKYQGVKTAHMNLLLGLIETLRKSPQSFSVTELSHAQSELTELTDAAFKLDWLKSKLEEVPLERKKALSDGSWVQQLEERVKNVELALCDLKVELEKE